METGFLKCDVSSGLFPEERSVTFSSADGERVELFCSKDFLKGDNLEVEILDKKDTRCLVRLPADPLTASRDVVVNLEDIRVLQKA